MAEQVFFCDGIVMKAEFFDFVSVIRAGVKNREIKISKDMTYLDMACEFASGKLYDLGKRQMTIEELTNAIIEYCGNDIIYSGTDLICVERSET